MFKTSPHTSKLVGPPRIIMLSTSFIAACVIGLVVALLTVIFVGLVIRAETWRVDSIANFDRFSITLFLCQTSLLSAGMFILVMLRRLLNISRWHGPADVIHAAHTNMSLLSIKTGIATILSVLVSVIAGASVGIYGPLVHFGAFLSKILNSIFRATLLSHDMLIGCGVAAAISAGFNAPIAGMIFAHEVVLRHFSMRALAPIAIASIASFSVSSWLFEDIRWLRLDISVPSILSLSPGLLISGLFFGIISVLIIRLQIKVSTWAVRSGLKDWELGGVAVVICAFLGFLVPEALGLGPATVRDMLSLEFGLGTLLIFLTSKIILTAASTCLGYSLGIFSPSLFIGAAAGGVAGSILNLAGLPISLPIFMVCGMAALSGAVTGAPIAVMVIIIEMTMSYDLAVATMIAVGTCSFISFIFGGSSLFDQQLQMRNINITGGRVALLLAEMPIDDLANENYSIIPKRTSVEKAAKLLSKNGHSEGYCLESDGALLGKVRLQDLVGASKKTSLAAIIDKNPIILLSDSSVEKAREVASGFLGEAIPVVEKETRKFVGVISEADIFTAVLETQRSVTSLEKA